MGHNSPLPDMKQQTAVEWIVSKLSITYQVMYSEEINQALAMEKEQIMDAHIEGQRVFDTHQHTQWTTDQAELYYNQTYGK